MRISVLILTLTAFLLIGCQPSAEAATPSASVAANNPIRTDDYLPGRYRATVGFDAGCAPARGPVAESIDGYLSPTTGTQRDCISCCIDPTTRADELAPMDRTPTDAARARYGVPLLAQMLQKYPEAALRR